MKKIVGLSAIIALITCGIVFSDEVKSIVEQNADPDAAQAVESAVDDSDDAPIQEALPEDSDAPAAAASEVVEEIIEEAQPESEQPAPAINTPFILGVITSPVPPMVRAQINLPENSGLFVQTIKPNGPAAIAGVQPYDIITAIDGAVISNTIDLASKIQSAAGKPQKLTVLRHGKELTLDVTAQPADAPRQPHGLMLGNPVPPTHHPFIDPLAPNYDPDEDVDDPAFPRLQRFMDRQRQQMEIMRQRMEAMENAMRQGMPGFVPFAPNPALVPTPAPIPNGALTPAPAPNGGMVLPPMNDPNNPNVQVQRDSFSVQVQKNGNEPAIIKIQENGNEYIVDENSLDQLPENVRSRLNFKIQSDDK